MKKRIAVGLLCLGLLVPETTLYATDMVTDVVVEEEQKSTGEVSENSFAESSEISSEKSAGLETEDLQTDDLQTDDTVDDKLSEEEKAEEGKSQSEQVEEQENDGESNVSHVSEKVEEQWDTETDIENKGEEGNKENAEGEESTEESELDGVIQTYSTKHTQAEAIQWVKAQVGKPLDLDGWNGEQCVDLILAYYDYLGVPRSSGNGSDYTWNSLPSGWKRIQGAAPQPGDILVYTGGAGHVAIYESDYSTYHQNFNSNRYVERITSIRYNGFSNPYWGVIRPDFGSKWYSSLTPVNIGNEVYASILKNNGWATIGCLNGKLQIIKPLNDGADIWKLVRQNDGSYIIYNCKNNKVLDVNNAGSAEGTSVGVFDKGGDNNWAQKWYIYGRWSGEYVLRPQCSDHVLTVKNGSNAIGTGLELRAYNNGTAQQLAFYTQQKAQPTHCSVSKGSSKTETKITWTKASYASTYNVRIFTGQPGNIKEYKTLWNQKGTSCNIILPVGYYEVYIDACNSFSYAKSNVVSFNVGQYIPGKVSNLQAVAAGKNKTKISWASVYGADGYLIYAQKNGKYGYCGMTTKGTTYTDTKALDTDYNYYWVYPYVKNTEGKMIVGGTPKYVYAKGVIPAVQYLKAASVSGGVKLTWKKQMGVTGYLIYGIRPGGKYGYIGMTTQGNTFTDKKASKKDYTFYWVFPYHKNAAGKMIVGGTPKYTYGRAR